MKLDLIVFPSLCRLRLRHHHRKLRHVQHLLCPTEGRTLYHPPALPSSLPSDSSPATHTAGSQLALHWHTSLPSMFVKFDLISCWRQLPNLKKIVAMFWGTNWWASRKVLPHDKEIPHRDLRNATHKHRFHLRRRRSSTRVSLRSHMDNQWSHYSRIQYFSNHFL